MAARVTEGWRHATIGEVCALFERYLPAVYPPAMSCPIVGTDFPTPTDSGFALEFLRFLGTTGHTDGLGGSGTRGLAAGPSPPEAGQVILGLPTYYAGVTQNPGDTLSSSSPTVGHFLVRDDLPRKLPALSGSAVLGLAASLSCAAFRFLRPGDTRPGSRS